MGSLIERSFGVLLRVATYLVLALILVKGFGFSEPGIQCFSVYCVDEL